ncbi:hypothetical protein [Paraburkholderia dipogonis]|uniref:hypothetical protein n=1 Tax=Paraburkholderia dipogonis TaxID=1211383 RepID=UPI0038B791F1
MTLRRAALYAVRIHLKITIQSIAGCRKACKIVCVVPFENYHPEDTQALMALRAGIPPFQIVGTPDQTIFQGACK